MKVIFYVIHRTFLPAGFLYWQHQSIVHWLGNYREAPQSAVKEWPQRSKTSLKERPIIIVSSSITGPQPWDVVCKIKYHPECVVLPTSSNQPRERPCRHASILLLGTGSWQLVHSQLYLADTTGTVEGGICFKSRKPVTFLEYHSSVIRRAIFSALLELGLSK